MVDRFVDPYTKQALSINKDGNLYNHEGNGASLYKCYDGCFDFVVENNVSKTAREVYDDTYSKTDISNLTLAGIAQEWTDATVPWRKTMIDSLGKLSGKRILLLGNGVSFKEFHFLQLGASVVFTDLSLAAVRRARNLFRQSELWDKYQDAIEFHAVDAMHLPFEDGAFDVIYGAKFVGFLADPSQFFTEVSRCLNSNGICRFADDAVSPVWDFAKRKFVRSIQKCVFRSPTSLDHLRSGGDGGFRENEVLRLFEKGGFKKMLFVREYFFLRIVQLCYGKLVGWNPKYLRLARPLYFTLKWVDKRLNRTNWMKINQLALTWGFDK
jgi:ubiquinone/menaquinone biosynthesis C-methylase UbiE